MTCQTTFVSNRDGLVLFCASIGIHIKFLHWLYNAAYRVMHAVMYCEFEVDDEILPV